MGKSIKFIKNVPPEENWGGIEALKVLNKAPVEDTTQKTETIKETTDIKQTVVEKEIETTTPLPPIPAIPENLELIEEEPVKEKKYAYITYLSTDDYIYCVMALAESLRATNPQYPFYCAVTKGLSRKTLNILKKLNIETIKLNTKPFDAVKEKIANVPNMSDQFINSTYKLAICGLTQFDKIVYLDSDLLINSNIDSLFNYPSFASVEPESALDPMLFIARQQIGYREQDDLFCAGMFVFEPTKEFFEKLKKTIKTLNFDTTNGDIWWNDQKILAYMCQDWFLRGELHIPVHYDVPISTPFITDYLQKYTKKDIIIEHYVYLKYYPLIGEKHIVADGKYTFHKKYMEYMNSIIDKYNLDLPKNNIDLLSCPLIEDGWY